jgi:hypothetical protein
VPETAAYTKRASRRQLLLLLIGLETLSTAIHYTHNFVYAHSYPAIGGFGATEARIAILVFWPLGTALALTAYRWYGRGRGWDAHYLLYAYALLGVTTPLHFLGGTPRISPFFMLTIFTDFATALAVWVLGWRIGRDARAVGAVAASA